MMVWAKDRDGRAGSTPGCSRIGSTSGGSSFRDHLSGNSTTPAVSSWDGRETRLMNVSHMTPWVCSEITTPTSSIEGTSSGSRQTNFHKKWRELGGRARELTPR